MLATGIIKERIYKNSRIEIVQHVLLDSLFTPLQNMFRAWHQDIEFDFTSSQPQRAYLAILRVVFN